MNGFPTELIYALIVGAILLFQFMMRQFGQQGQKESAQDERLPQMPDEVKETPAAYSASSGASAHFGRAESPSASFRLPTRRFARRSLMGTKRKVQNAIVVATIVGRCRAFEPHDVRIARDGDAGDSRSPIACRS